MAIIEIDGKKIEIENGKMIIEAADDAGINIPRFCYHKKLSIAANCRMCLVEVEKSRKPLPACATPITDGMKVFTKSPMALAAQKAVMEFLLINHPLDCPICDQGGECELQDVSMGYGGDISRFTEGKRSVDDEDIGPLIATEMTRCINCTRCIRFGDEVAGLRELGVTGRGERSQIATYIKHSLQSEISGNIIDLCPVGALTSKPYRFTARPWELKQLPSVAPHDCLGSNIYIHARRGQVMRVVPRDNETINETWLSDRDRFSYLGLYSSDRLGKPMIKQQGQWQETDWETALKFTVTKLQKIIKDQGAEQVGALMSPSTTVEEGYLFQKLMRGIGVTNIDHRLQQTDFSDESFMPALIAADMPYAEIENQQAILLLGSNLVKEQPLAAVRVRKANARGAEVMAINSVDFDFHFELSHKIICDVNHIAKKLTEIAKILVPAALQKNSFLENVSTAVCHEVEKIAEVLRSQSKSIIVVGAGILNHPDAAKLSVLIQMIAQFSQTKVFYMTPGANSRGACLVDAQPQLILDNNEVGSPNGLNCQEMFKRNLSAYVLLGLEPELDCANPVRARNSLEDAKFVVSLLPFMTDTMRQYADVILPITPFTETAGTFVNVEGKWQTFAGCAQPFDQARPAWKVLRVLGNLFDVHGFDYQNAEEVLAEARLSIKKAVKRMNDMTAELSSFELSMADAPVAVITAEDSLTRIGEWPMYTADSLVRRALSLQQSAANEPIAVRVNPQLAQKHNLVEGELVIVAQAEVEVCLPLMIDERIHENCVYVPNGYPETAGLGDPFGRITLKRFV